MGVLITGLLIFLGLHLMRVLGVRTMIVRVTGDALFVVYYSILSAIGLTLIVYGHILSHPSETIWYPPEWTRTVALVATPIAFVLLIAAYLPCHIRSITRHPMTLGVFLWSGSHLLANGELSSIVLFGSFAFWSLVLLIEGYVKGGRFERAGAWGADIAALTLGLGGAGVLAFFHMQIFGVAVIGFASEPIAPGI